MRAVFVGPLLVVLAAVAAWPLLRTFALALTDATLATPGAPHFVGVSNYDFLVRDPDWWRAVANTLAFTAVSVTCETILGLVVALVVDARFRGRGLLRAAVLVPWAIPTIVSAKMWAWMLHDLYGVVNEVLVTVGVLETRLAWTADPSLARFSIVAVDVWKTTPFMALLLLAALQAVPRDLYEAAALDGVSALTVFRRITLPLIRPALAVAVVFRSLDALRMFDLVYVLTPNQASTMTMSTYVRQQLIDFQDTGYGSAAASLVFAVVAVATAVYLTTVRGRLWREEPAA
ncbi:MAG: sugar ABC transporter permease [Vicinamibacterales bacterium]